MKTWGSSALRMLGALLALAATAYLAMVAWAVFPFQPTADFYQFWGVGAAHESGSIRVLPYSDRAPYDAALRSMAAASASEKLQTANALRSQLDPTGTPFFYSVFAALPRDYDTAQALFLVLVYTAGFCGVFAIGRLRGFSVAASACVAAGVGLTFGPFIVDVRVGNVNSLQLACIAGFLALASRRDPRPAGDNWAMGMLAAFVVFKPNTLLVAAALGVRHLLTGRDPRAALLTAAGVAVASLVAGSWYFGDPAAWTEWMRYARRLAGADPSIAFETGNQSLAMWLARHARSQMPGAFGLALGFALAAAIAAVASGPTRDLQLAARTLRRAMADPFFAVSSAILLTLAVSPLVWIHYLVLALVPILWLVRGNGLVAAIGAIVAYTAVARPTISLIMESSAAWLIEPVTLLAWLALIPGTLSFVARMRRDVTCPNGNVALRRVAPG